MAVWGAVAAAAIAAAANIYMSESAKAGKNTAPGAPEAGGKNEKFAMPDIFGGNKPPDAGGGSLMGGKSDTRLSQELGAAPTEAPKFGPQGGGSFDEMNRNRQISEMQKGK